MVNLAIRKTGMENDTASRVSVWYLFWIKRNITEIN